MLHVSIFKFRQVRGNLTYTCHHLVYYSGKKGSRGKKQVEKHHEEENQNETCLEMDGYDPLGNISIKHLTAAMEALNLQQKPAKTPEEALTKSYQFWNTQPVPKMGKYRANLSTVCFFFVLGVVL